MTSCGFATQTSCRCLGHPNLLSYGPKCQRGELFLERTSRIGIRTAGQEPALPMLPTLSPRPSLATPFTRDRSFRVVPPSRAPGAICVMPGRQAKSRPHTSTKCGLPPRRNEHWRPKPTASAAHDSFIASEHSVNQPHYFAAGSAFVASVQVSVRNGEAGSPTLFPRFGSASSCHPNRTATGFATPGLVTTTVSP